MERDGGKATTQNMESRSSRGAPAHLRETWRPSNPRWCKGRIGARLTSSLKSSSEDLGEGELGRAALYFAIGGIASPFIQNFFEPFSIFP
jgi:hypothetical protein